MNKHLLTSAILAGLLLGTSAYAELYKWVDENGVTHYGDHIPPQYNNDPHERFNESGVLIGKDEGELSPEEAAARADQKRINQERQDYDNQLLKSYERVSDIERLRETRLADLKQEDDLARNYLKGLEQRLKDLEVEAQRYNYPYDPLSDKPAVPDNLTRELMDTTANVQKYRDLLTRRLHQRDEMIASFARDIKRFRELKAKQ